MEYKQLWYFTKRIIIFGINIRFGNKIFQKFVHVIERIIGVVINFASYSEACGFKSRPEDLLSLVTF
jgi:hypothetical protein